MVFMRREMGIQQNGPVGMHGVMSAIVLLVKRGTEISINACGEYEMAALCREVNA